MQGSSNDLATLSPQAPALRQQLLIIVTEARETAAISFSIRAISDQALAEGEATMEQMEQIGVLAGLLYEKIAQIGNTLAAGD